MIIFAAGTGRQNPVFMESVRLAVTLAYLVILFSYARSLTHGISDRGHGLCISVCSA